MALDSPGPGQVLQYAVEVDDSGYVGSSARADGIRRALGWVLGGDWLVGKQLLPVRKIPKSPPSIRDITSVARMAKALPGDDLEYSADYCTGVQECLEWIVGKVKKPHLP